MIGWALLSRRAVARAAEALEGDDKGVRDEIGFLALHQAIADHLFPGTSVLHTRARYALMVPWMMQRVAAEGARDAERRLLQAEGVLTAQLVHGDSIGLDARGAIGGRIWLRARRPSAQPASFSYWTALSAWGILRKDTGGGAPTRVEVIQRLARLRHTRSRGEDDPGPDDAMTSPFIAMPNAPAEFGNPSAPLDLVLTPVEKTFLRRQLIGVLREDGAQSYLARLAATGRPVDLLAPWEEGAARHADAADRAVLTLAEAAAALSAIGRALYAALTEAAWIEDRQSSSMKHAKVLETVRERYESVALRLDVDALARHFPQLPADLLRVLAATQEWLRSGASDPGVLRPLYGEAERVRKGDRARLPPTLGARRRRSEWVPDLHPEAVPLNFRWPNVTRLLADVAS
jgi:hypothetical protein